MSRSSRVRHLVRVARSAPQRVEELRRAAASVGAGDDRDAAAGSTFLRGLVAGALVGAAIAGSTIWERRHRRSGEHVSDSSAGIDSEP
ncbi:MAG TPA: hypothetical protein VFW02_10195 [Candidatus Limnocylindrales bacterium]|nr:hypothetical protein [Candidatus Limnocylindrales bacterium]